jgi:hypothetical protein
MPTLRDGLDSVLSDVWHNDSTFGVLPSPDYEGGSILLPQGSSAIYRDSLGDGNGVFSCRIRFYRASEVRLALFGAEGYDASSPPPGSSRWPSVFGAYEVDGFSDVTLLPFAFGGSGFGFWTPFARAILDAAPDGTERDGRMDVFFDKVNSRVAAVFTIDGVRFVSGWVAVSGVVPDWGQFALFLTSYDSVVPEYRLNISDILIQYDWDAEQVEESYLATIGGGTVGGAGQVTDGPPGYQGLPGQVGGVPSAAPALSRVAPSSSLKISHARIVRAYRSEADARTFHDQMRAS